MARFNAAEFYSNLARRQQEENARRVADAAVLASISGEDMHELMSQRKDSALPAKINGKRTTVIIPGGDIIDPVLLKAGKSELLKRMRANQKIINNPTSSPDAIELSAAANLQLQRALARISYYLKPVTKIS
jgi:hypothetical protein